MILRITKADVLEAIDKENLCSNSWVDSGTCRYCAVGAVLKRAGINDFVLPIAAGKVTNYQCNDDDNLPNAIARGKWLSALSIKFEQLSFKLADRLSVKPKNLESEQLDELKPTLKEWVNATLPDGVIYEGEVA